MKKYVQYYCTGRCPVRQGMKPSTDLRRRIRVTKSKLEQRLTVRVSGSGAPVRGPSVLTFTLSRAVPAHGPRQTESSETPYPLYAIWPSTGRNQ